MKSCFSCCGMNIVNEVLSLCSGQKRMGGVRVFEIRPESTFSYTADCTCFILMNVLFKFVDGLLNGKCFNDLTFWWFVIDVSWLCLVVVLLFYSTEVSSAHLGSFTFIWKPSHIQIRQFSNCKQFIIQKTMSRQPSLSTLYV